MNLNHTGACGSAVPEHGVSSFTHSEAPHWRHLLSIQPWYDCYPGNEQTHAVSVGIALDYGAYKLLNASTDAIEEFVSSLFASANKVYLAQPNIKLVLQKIIVFTTSKGVPWNQDPGAKSCPNIEYEFNILFLWRSLQLHFLFRGLLDSFTDWVEEESTPKYAIWHLITNCYPPPGTIGAGVAFYCIFLIFPCRTGLDRKYVHRLNSSFKRIYNIYK